MTNINRLVILTATVAFCGLVAGAGPVSAETKEARGTVAAVTTTTMTIKVPGAQEMTFFIDGDTRLEVRRAARQIQSLQPDNKLRVNDFFEVGNPVLVRYDEKDGGADGFHALNIERVGSAGKANPSGIAEGKVTSVSASHMTVASGGRDMTFAITGDTDVMAKGASKAKKAAGGGTPLTTFVKTGDMVSVSYKESAGAITASQIRVRVPNRN
jgi:hypothetical protein